MKILVLPQTLHDGEVHTVDINSSNDLVATGGKDLTIFIWKYLEFSNITSFDREGLAHIVPAHNIKIYNSTVKTIKWSPANEHVFISGDMNGQIYVSNIQDNTNRLVYPWPAIKEKQISVIDGSWSPDGRLFAWCTSDGMVHIFDVSKDTYQGLTANKNDGKVTIQRSIAFDPTNNYFVTVGDDTFVNVYQYHFDSNGNYQFKILSKISKLMNNSATVTSGINYRRVSWSCDGEYFSVPNASKQLSALISLLSRSLGWGNKISLVGHEMACEVVKFAPKIFQANDPDIPLPTEEHHIFHVLASAGSDKTLVLWNTTKDSPIFVLRDAVSKPITDLVWDKSSSRLLFVSLDGHLGLVQFDNNELGFDANSEVVERLKESQKLFIKPFAQKTESENSTSKKSKSLLEITDEELAINIKDAFEMKEQKPDQVKEQKETTVDPEDAKKLDSDVTGDMTPVVLAPGENVEEADDILSSAMTDRNKTEVDNTQKVTKSKPSTKGSTKLQTPQTQKVTTKNGKKRIQPVLISNGQSSIPKSPISTSNATGGSKMNGSKTAKSLIEFEKPSYSVSEELQKENKRQKAQDELGANKKARRDLEAVKFVGTVVVNPSTTFAKVRLSVPKTRMAFRLTSKISGLSFTLDIKNGQGNEAVPSRITYFKNQQQVWCDFIPRYIQLATEGDNFWAVATADGQIITYSHISGMRFLPPIVLGSPLSFLESHSKYLMAVTSLAEIYVWDMEEKKLHMSSPASLAALLDLNNKYQEDVLSKADNITMCSITSKGIPLVTISNGSGYLYNLDMETWHTVSEAWWAFGSHYWDSITDDKMSSEPQTTKVFGKEAESSILGLLEHRTNEEIIRKSRIGRGKYFNKISKNMIMKEGFESLENNISLSHLENRMLCCELLGEKKDFHDFLITYTQRLCELGLKAKLFEICQQLLGSSVEPEENVGDTDKICGYDRKELVKEIILSCAENRDVQRILGHFSKKLGMIENDYS